MICPNQPLVCDAYSRFGSTGDPLRWYISQPAKCGPLTSHFSRLPSDVRMNAPLRVPTRTRTPLIPRSLFLMIQPNFIHPGVYSPRYARFKPSISILVICSMALKTLCDFTGSLSSISSSKALGTICHDTPNLSFSHAHCTSRPPAVSFSHNSSTSACVSQFPQNDMAGEKV